MPIQMYFKAKRFNFSVGLKIFWTLLLMALLCFSSAAFAGIPIGGKAGIDVYNVGVGSFSVVWQVDVDSNCSVRLFSDINGNTPVAAGSYTVHSGETPSQQLGLTRGVMQVDVKGLPPAVTTYYIQTVSTHGTEESLFPAFGDLIPVETEPATTAFPAFNNLLYLLLYDENGINPSDYQENRIMDGVVTIVYAKTADGTETANYPIAPFNTTNAPGTDNGFPQSSSESRIELLLGDFKKGKAEAGNYWQWTTDKNYTLTIKSYGGAVPDVGLGQSIITTTYQGSWTSLGATVGCLPNTDGCTEVIGLNFSQIVLRPNQGPVVPAIPDQNVNKGSPLTVNFCASDPEGDAVVGFALIKSPTGMVLTPDPADANCATITWTPSACDVVQNVQFTVTDDQGSASTTSFNVNIKRCPPYKPGGSITPPTPVTSQNLTCTAVSNGDPDGETINFKYAWYDVAAPGTILSTTSMLNSPATIKNKAYACRVIAYDSDGDSEPFIAGPVTVLNSPPTTPGSAVVTPAAPTTEESLTCTISASTDPDNDTVQYIYVWSCGACGEPTVQHGPKSGLTDTLDSGNTSRGQNWKCDVRATDGTAESTAKSSNSVSIANLPPSDPGGIQITPASNVKTGNALTCTIGTTSTDPDGDEVEYVFTWNCSGDGCGTQTSIERTPKAGISDILASNDTAKDQTWSCSVFAKDKIGEGAKSATIQSGNSVVVENSPPVGLTVNITPDPTYVNDNLTCTSSGVTDGDGDAISYKYVWKKDGAVVAALTKDFTSGKTTDTVQAVNTSQGETWACEVTAKDTSDEEVGPISDQVFIDNQPPVITTVPTADPHIWDEEQTYTIEVLVSDPDGNEFTLEIDTNYIHPDDPNVSEWLEFDSVNNILTATPPFGSSAFDFGDGSGILKINFIVEETDGTPNKRVEKLVNVLIRFPAVTIDDFEYTAAKPTLADNGWYRLQGTGSMALKQEDPNDPNSNHYLKTSVSGTPTKNSQLNYIVYKNIPVGSPYNNEYPVIMFSVKDMNLYYVDLFVKGKNNTGQEENFFMRYIPQDPNVAGWTTKKSGDYVMRNIGNESIDPNSDVVIEVESNMETDLFNETGFHYLYLKGIVLRGDINFMDDIKVRSAPPLGFPKDVVNLAAIGSENQVTLQWTLPENQIENIAGYRIYMDANDPPAKEEAFRIATETADKTSYTKTGLANGVTYCFRITAIDNLLTPNETEGVTVCATPEVTIPLAPVNVTAESIDSTIQLNWENPPGQHPDLAGYVIYYCDCVSGDCSACYAAPLVAPDKADATGLFTQYITKDANQEFLQYGTTYSFTVKAKDTAQPANLSAGKKVSITLDFPSKKIIDNFDKDYQSGQTLRDNGWYRLQGKGQFMRKIGIGINNYLEVKSNYTGASALAFNIMKTLPNPADYTNPYFAANIRSLGNFEIVLYLKGMDGNNYFLGYKADVTAEEDSLTPTKVENRYYVFKLGWKDKSSTEWYEIERNLDDDLMAAKGTGFKMLLNVILRGTLDVDNLELGEGIPEAENLTARPGDSSVLLSWTIPDPNKIDETKILVNGALEDTITVTSDKNDYEYEVTGLTNNTPYEFKLVQVAEGDESKGVSVNATPMEYKTSFTFDDQAAVDEWTLQVSEGVALSLEYDSGVQSNVMYLNPSGDYPDRYYAYMDGMNVSDVAGMTCRIRTSSNFVIWLHLEDTIGMTFMLGFVPGGTAESHSRFGNFGYYFLGPDLTDGKWHSFDLKLDDVMGSIFTGVGVNKVMGIYFGGRIYIDDVSIY
ncbi:MAG: fibronectin type III domain-containing protein [bacterium]